MAAFIPSRRDPEVNEKALAKVRGLSAGWRNNDIGARLMTALEGAQPLGVDELPERGPSRPGLTKDGALVADLLNARTPIMQVFCVE